MKSVAHGVVSPPVKSRMATGPVEEILVAPLMVRPAAAVPSMPPPVHVYGAVAWKVRQFV